MHRPNCVGINSSVVKCFYTHPNYGKYLKGLSITPSGWFELFYYELFKSISILI